MRKLLLVIWLLICVNFLFAQNPATHSKVTCPIYKIENSTVAPINYPSTIPSSRGWLYSLSDHLYWGTTQLDAGQILYTATSPISLIGNDIHILPDTLTAWWTKQNQGAVAYSWGNHSLAGYELITNKQNSTSTSVVKYPTWYAAKAYMDSIKGTISIPDTNAIKFLGVERASHTYEPKIGISTTANYWRGDKTWQPLPTYISSQWTTEPDGIYYAGKVGIGVTNPTSTDSTLQGTSASFTRGVRIDKKLIVKTMPVIAGNADTAVVWNANDSSFARQAIGDCPTYEEGVRTQEFTATAGQTNFVVTLFTANAYYVPMIDYCPQSHLIVTRSDNTFTYSPGLKAGQKLIIMN